MSAQSIKRVFLNVSMANRIDGLRKIAKDAGFDPRRMGQGDYIFFVNSGRDKIAALVGAPQGDDRDGAVMCYCKMGSGNKITMNAIRYIPTFFDGKSINYDKALSLAVEDALANRARKKMEMF